LIVEGSSEVKGMVVKAGDVVSLEALGLVEG